MALEIERLAGQQMFARMMEMELLQLVACAADDAGRTGCRIDLDRMAIVDDAKFHRLIGDIQAPNFRGDGVARSIGDCSRPSWQTLKAGDSSPQLAAPASPS